VNYILWGEFWSVYWERLGGTQSADDFYKNTVQHWVEWYDAVAHHGKGAAYSMPWVEAGFYLDFSAVPPTALNGTGPGQDANLLPSYEPYSGHLTFTITPDLSLDVYCADGTARVKSAKLFGEDVTL
jgi:hypothetical protein